MIIKLSRFLLIAVIICLAAMFLPEYYWIGFGERIFPPQVRYSPLTKDFLVGNSIDKNFVWMGLDGKQYTREQSDSLMPFSNYRLLAAKGLMPDTINGQKIELDEVRLNNIFERIRPYVMDAPEIKLYPLFESKPPRLQLELPTSFFRITDRMEFITAETNQVDEKLSQVFTEALEKENFNFPMTGIYGNPTTRKPFDEGYFIVDSESQMFHVKMIHGKPHCKNIHLPEDVKVKYLSVREAELREFYGLLISQDDQLYLLMYDQYRLQPLPIEDYNSEQDMIMFIGNLQVRTFLLNSDHSSRAFVTDRSYKLIAQHKETWQGYDDLKVAKIGKYLFPFQINLTRDNSKFVNLNFSSYHFNAVYLNILFIILTIILLRYRRTSVVKKWYDILIVLITGIFGFIAVSIIENTDFY
jgi:hypothetical protein